LATKLKLGVLGMSEGNGHPYSWSAIFNGYDPVYMKDCPYPAIPAYLAEYRFPEDGLSHLGEVTHVWTQERSSSEHIAAAAKIANVVEEPGDMIGHIDAVLLARDDAENHYEMALPYIQAGLPIFIDKPLALSVRDAKAIIDAEQFTGQIFTCSSLRYAKEMALTETEKEQIGEIHIVEGSVMKKWETYAIHVIEPLVAQMPGRGLFLGAKEVKKNGIRQVLVGWENLSAYIKVTGSLPSPIQLSFFGDKGSIEKKFFNSFDCFKTSLEKFVYVASGEQENIDRQETLEIIEIIESVLR